MQVLFKSRHPQAGELRELAERRVRFVLRRLGWLVPRAEVLMSDVNGPRGGIDKRCQVELRTDGAGPVVVTSVAKDWRTERRFGKLEALLAVADAETSLIISGTGDVIEPEDGIIAIGSGGSYALSAARALLAHTEMDAKSIAVESLHIAGDICIYTNRNVVVEEL